MIYESGETVILFADMFPALIEPTPPGVPGPAVKLRVIASERCLTVAWQVGSEIYRADIEMTPEQTSEMTFRGGVMGPYRITQDSRCRCGARQVLGWVPFPGVIWQQQPRVEKVVVDRSTYGLIPKRYSSS